MDQYAINERYKADQCEYCEEECDIHRRKGIVPPRLAMEEADRLRRSVKPTLTYAQKAAGEYYPELPPDEDYQRETARSWVEKRLKDDDVRDARANLFSNSEFYKHVEGSREKFASIKSPDFAGEQASEEAA